MKILFCTLLLLLAAENTALAAETTTGELQQALFQEFVPQAVAPEPTPETDVGMPDIEAFFESSTGRYPARAEIYRQHPLNDVFDLFVYLDGESDGYKEGYFGPVWKMDRWLQIGLGVGVENPGGLRKALWIDANLGDLHVTVSFENGHTGAWHEATAVYKCFDRLGIGLMDRTELGRGPRVEYELTESFVLWGAILTTHGSTALTLGIKKDF